MIAVVGPEGHLLLGVVDGMQRVPPAEIMAEPVAPVIGAIQDQHVDYEGDRLAAHQPGYQAFQGGRHVAMVGQRAVQPDLELVEQHERHQRHDADAVQQRVENVHRDGAAVGPVFQPAPFLHGPADGQHQQHLGHAVEGEQHPAIGDVVPLHHVELVEHRQQPVFMQPTRGRGEWINHSHGLACGGGAAGLKAV